MNKTISTIFATFSIISLCLVVSAEQAQEEMVAVGMAVSCILCALVAYGSYFNLPSE